MLSALPLTHVSVKWKHQNIDFLCLCTLAHENNKTTSYKAQKRTYVFYDPILKHKDTFFHVVTIDSYKIKTLPYFTKYDFHYLLSS